MNTAARTYYLDNLKVFLTLLVIFHHAGQAYGDGGDWAYQPTNANEYLPMIWHFLWLAIPIMGLILMKGFNKKRPSQVKTYIDTSIGYVWLVLGITCVLFSIITFFARVNILSMIVLLIGVGCAITGLIIKYLPVTVGGFIALALSVVLLLTQQSFDFQILIFIAAFVATCIIPGHCLHRKVRKAVKLEEEGHV